MNLITEEILERLLSLARSISSDFNLMIFPNAPSGGWFFNPSTNEIYYDPLDLEKKGLEFCLGIIAHESAHKRITRLDIISDELWSKVGFSLLFNSIEDIRVNNWLIKTYEGAKDWIKKVYEEEFPEDEIMKDTKPYIAFCLGIIREWLRGKFPYQKYSLLGSVFEKVKKDLKIAYNMIPSKNPSENEIIECAKNCYLYIYKKIWPEYKKLVDQSTVKSSSFSFMFTFSTDFPEDFEITDLECKINEKLMGKLVVYPINKILKRKIEEEIDEFKKELRKIREGYKSKYDYIYEQIAQYIGGLYTKLAKILLPRRYPKWEDGYSFGLKLNLKELMKFESRGDYTSLWQRKAKPIKKDYRFSIVVDLSGSMMGVKICETIKAVVLLVEVLDKLNIPIEIIGFHEDQVKLYKSFEEKLNDNIRNKIVSIIEEVGGRTNTDSATKIASDRLMHYHSKEKFLITFTDGKPDSTRRSRTKKLIDKIIKERRQKLIGIGLGPIDKIKEVKLYYPETILVENISKLPEIICDVIKRCIT